MAANAGGVGLPIVKGGGAGTDLAGLRGCERSQKDQRNMDEKHRKRCGAHTGAGELQGMCAGWMHDGPS